jgi:transcription elongation factor GreA
MADAHHISQTAHDRLSAELLELRTHGRIDLADRIERAREHGDLKENAEYHAAKEEKAKMEARIAKIAGILENAVIIEGEGDGTVAAWEDNDQG